MEGWCVQVVGEEAVRRLSGVLTPPSPVLIEEMRPGEFLLRDEAWASTRTEDEVEAAGRELISIIEGVGRLHFGNEFGDLRFGGVIFVRADGGRDYDERGTVVAGAMVWAEEIHIGPDGMPVPAPPSALPTHLAAAQAHDDLAEALARYGKASDWPDLYNVFEVLRDMLGGDREVKRRFGDASSRFTSTAQSFRHARRTGQPPSKPMTYAEGDAFVALLLRTAIDAD
jgi:hypothetical protein